MANGYKLLNQGGIAIVSSPNMESMAREAWEEVQKCTEDTSIGFHVLNLETFSMGEFLPHVEENVRNMEVYLFFDFNEDAARNMFVLAASVSAIHRASAKSISLVVPFIPFLRQDRKDRSRIPITGRVALDVMEMYPIVRRIITLDMHTAQCEMGITNPFDHLPGYVILVPWLREHYGDDLDSLVIVGPDAGSEKRVMKIATELGCERSFFTKSRAGRGDVEMDVLHGADVSDKICVLNDDMIDTAGTIVKAAEALLHNGARKVLITATHPVFGTKDGVTAYEKLRQSGFEVIVTNSLHTKPFPWLTVLPLGRYMAYTILQNISAGGSVSQIITDGLPA